MVSVFPLSVGVASTAASCTVVSPASWPSNEIETLSPALMSGVTCRFVPAPQQAPPGWLTSNATSPSATTASAEPMTCPARVTFSSAVSPMWSW